MSFCKDCGKPHKGKKEEYIEEKEVVREPFPYDPAPSEDKKESNKCSKCGGIIKKSVIAYKNALSLIRIIVREGGSAKIKEKGAQGFYVEAIITDELGNQLSRLPHVDKGYRSGHYWTFELKG